MTPIQQHTTIEKLELLAKKADHLILTSLAEGGWSIRVIIEKNTGLDYDQDYYGDTSEECINKAFEAEGIVKP